MSGTEAVSKKRLWTGRVLTGLAAAFLVMDIAMHTLKPAPVVDAFARLGYPLGLAIPIAVLELICLAAYLLPEDLDSGSGAVDRLPGRRGSQPCARGRSVVRRGFSGDVRRDGVGRFVAS